MSLIRSPKRTLFLFSSLLLLLASSAQALNDVMSQSQLFNNAASPNNFAWELRNANNDFVRWNWNNVASTGGGVRVLQATAATAASVGVDWNAWTAAVLDPAYNRVLLTFASVTLEKPWPIFPSQRDNFHDLRVLEFGVGPWYWPADGHTQMQVTVAARNAVPEPAAWLMLCIGLMHGCISRVRR